MKKLLLIPVILFPFLLVLGVWLGKLFSEDVAPVVFGAVFAFFALATPICNVIFMILTRKDEPVGLVRTVLLVKLIHVPAYIAVFVFGVIASLMIFMTLLLVLMLILFDCVVLFFSSSVSVFAVAKNIKNNKILSVAALICQFFFCAHVISLLVLRIAARQPSSPAGAQPPLQA